MSEVAYEYMSYENYDEVRTIYSLHKGLFNTENYDDLFSKALLNLIEGHLVFTESCIKVDEIIRNKDRLMMDRICISTSGLFYLSNFLHKIEYIYFIKDDMDWIGDPRTLGLDPAAKDVSRNQKFVIALRSVHSLMQLELKMLSGLCERAEDEGSRMLIDYRELFSGYYPYVGHDNVLITDLFGRNMIQFAKKMLKDEYEYSGAAKEEKSLDWLIKENKSLLEAFAI